MDSRAAYVVLTNRSIFIFIKMRHTGALTDNAQGHLKKRNYIIKSAGIHRVGRRYQHFTSIRLRRRWVSRNEAQQQSGHGVM